MTAWERIAAGDEARVNALLARTLRLDLNRLLGRRLDKRIFTTSLQCIPLGGEPAEEGFEDRAIDTMSHGVGTLRGKYPMLVRHLIDGYPIREIATDEGVCVQAIWKRIAKEKTVLARMHGMTGRHNHHAA